MASSAIRLILAAGAGLSLTLAAYALLPDELEAHTDIVGNPTFVDFNIDRYFESYGLIVLFLPLVTLGLYVVLTRVFVGRLGPWRPLPEPNEQIEAIPGAAGWREWGVSAGRTLFVGGAFGLEVAIWFEQASEVVVTTTVAYGTGVFVAGWIAARLDKCDRFVVMSALNTLAAPLLVAGLWGVSSSTELTVTSTGEVHDYRWLPAWLAFGAAAMLLAYLAVLVRRRHGRAGLTALERTVVLLVVAPVALFVLMAALPGELGTFDSFEEGQALAGSELVRNGAFPWRDVFISHGLFFDVGRGLLGSAVFDDSRWGLVAGDGIFLVPLAWVALYYLCAYLLWTNWLFLLGTQFVVVSGHVTAIEPRLVLVPFVLLLLAALLARPTWPRAAAFTVVLTVQVLVIPEALVAGIASLLTLAAFEFSYTKRGRGFLASYPRMMRCLAIAAVIGLGWLAFLASFGALRDWLLSFAATIPGHRLTGGLESLVPKTQFEVLAPIALVLVVLAFVVARVRLRRPFSRTDWVMVAMAGFTLLYFMKFLSRADPQHLEQSFAASVPLLFYVVFRGVTFAEARLAGLARTRGLPWFPRRHSLTLPVLVVLLVGAPVPLHDAIRAAPGHFVAAAEREPEVAGIGYARSGENDPNVLRGLADGLNSLLEPGDTVFDFSNAPGVFHYLLEEDPSTPYYHVSYAIRQRTQTDLVRRLGANPAGAVVLTSPGPGSARGFNSLPSWDGIANQVRHYDVSEHLLDRYVPVRDVGGFVLMAPRDRGGEAVNDLYFRSGACDWGYVPNFFSPRPADDARSMPLPLRRLNDGTRFALTLPDDAAEYGWLELRTGAPLAEARFEVTDRPRGDRGRSIAFATLARDRNVVRVKVGACSQWRGYEPGVIYLTSNVAQDLDEARLVD